MRGKQSFLVVIKGLLYVGRCAEQYVRGPARPDLGVYEGRKTQPQVVIMRPKARVTISK